MFKEMPVSLEFLRGVLGVLCVIFAHFAGRTAAAVKKGRQKPSRLTSWMFRTLACAIAISIRHPLDMIVVAVWLLSVVAFAIGWWDVFRERKEEEDLTEQIFPK